MKVILASINDMGKAAIEELTKQNAELLAVFTVRERGDLYMDISGFDEICKEYNIPLYQNPDINSKEIEDLMKNLEPDLCMCMGWNQIIKKNILSIPRYGWIGSHPTKLPLKGETIDPKINSAAGNEPCPYAIRGEYEKTALSLFWLEPKVDVGDIFAQEIIDLDTEHETSRTLIDKICDALRKIIREKFPLILEGKAPRLPQELENLAPYMEPIIRDENIIDFSKPIEENYRLIRSSIHPYPNAFIEFGGQRIYIESAHLENGVFTELKVRVGGGPYKKQ